MNQYFNKEDWGRYPQENMSENEIAKAFERFCSEKDARGKGQRHLRKKYKVGLIGGMVAAALLCVISIPKTSMADYINSFLNTHFSTSQEVTKNVEKKVYSDSDKHIKMNIEELLSDGACIYMSVSYEAIDEKGKEWLNNQDFDNDTLHFDIKQEFVRKHNGWTFGLSENEDARTSNTRHYTYYFFDLTGNYMLDKMTFCYPMYEGTYKETELLVEGNISKTSYRLEGKGSPSDIYMPRFITMSKISFDILGDNLGAYTYTTDGEEQHRNIEFTKKALKENDNRDAEDIVFIMKDGSKLFADVRSWGGANYRYYQEGKKTLDYSVATGQYLQNSSSLNASLNPEEVSQVSINGYVYDLVKEELPE